MRIISGAYKGRRIEHPKDMPDAIRPTSDFAREAIFNILLHGKHGLSKRLQECKVLDLYCGTGAFGLEALSRGAAQVTFIDQSREAIAIARHNVERFGEEARSDYLTTDAARLSRARYSYDVIFLDPPYFAKLVNPTLNSLREGGWIGEDCLLVVEHDEKEELTYPAEFEVLDQRRYGRAVIELLRCHPERRA